MGLLSRYYVKECIQRRMIENAANEIDMVDDDIARLCNEVAYIQENIVKVSENANEAVSGFFASAGYAF